MKTSWKEDQLKRKTELAQIAKKIKVLKHTFCEYQKQMVVTRDLYNIQSDVSVSDIKYDSSIISTSKNAYIKNLYEMWSQQSELLELRKQYRYLHIIYCLNNGTPFSKIEPKHNEHNYKYDMHNHHIEIGMAELTSQKEAETHRNFLKLKHIEL
ncbi:MAG: hypothetical protein KAS32_27740 [Candidatus Peribacteraceae bacterium]|nr:hypothetical protein [Candidatus Peribacteraceae bacterium]